MTTMTTRNLTTRNLTTRNLTTRNLTTLRRAAVALAGGALAASSLIAGAPAMGAAPPCSTPAVILGTTITPIRVVLGTSVPKGITVTTRVRTSGCRIDSVEAGLYGPNFVDTYELDAVGSSNGVTTYETGLRIGPGTLPNSEAGRWQSFISVWGQSTPNAPGPGFTVVRAARLTTNASPEPVRKGRSITVTGKLERADWQTLRYHGYSKRKVQLQWRSPTGTYHSVATTTTADDGSVRLRVIAKRDGCYRFSFAGSSTTQAVTSRGDCVDVR
jgi:hypothetical protein